MMDTEVKTDTAVSAGQNGEAAATSDAKASAETPKAKIASYNMNFRIPKNQVDDSLQKLEIPMIQDRLQTEFESDRGYHMIAERVISASQRHLSEQQRDKTALRKLFAKVFSALLIAEYLVLVLLIILDGATKIPVVISDNILQLYIASVFVQTLTTMGVMIAFAFVSKEETRIVGLLNQIIQNYQKVKLNDDAATPKPGSTGVEFTDKEE